MMMMTPMPMLMPDTDDMDMDMGENVRCLAAAIRAIRQFNQATDETGLNTAGKLREGNREGGRESEREAAAAAAVGAQCVVATGRSSVSPAWLQYLDMCECVCGGDCLPTPPSGLSLEGFTCLCRELLLLPPTPILL